MKFSKILLAVLLAVFAFISCSDDDPKVYTSNAVRFDAAIENDSKVNLRMAGNSWDVNDEIGVYMKKAGQGLAGNVVGTADNIRHTTPGDGRFSPAILSQGVEYPEDGSNVDFIAYYPYTTPVTNYIYAVDLSTQTSQQAIDLLYSNNATGMNKNSSTSVALTFTHELTKLIINVEAGTGIGSLTGLVTTVTGTNTKADFALADGTLTPSASVADIRMLTTANGAKMQAEAVILPAAATAGRTVLFTLGTQTFKWDIPAATAFEKGKKYSYDAILSLDGVTFLTPDGTITNWIDVPGGSITPELQDGGDGSQANPYAISQLSGKVGETGKWVTGYIVGSTAKTRAIGTPSTENILLAPTANETDEANCIPVDISSSAVKEYLDIVASSDLIGTQVKVQGDIVNNIFGNTLSLTNITAQEGGKKAGGTGEVVEFFRETFGTGSYPSGNRPKIGEFTDFDMKAPYVFTDEYARADIRSTGTISASVWLPAYSASYDASSQLKITGIESGYTNMSLSYDIATNVTPGNTNTIIVKCNDVVMTVPSGAFSATNTFVTITLDIPDNTTVIEFFSDPNTNKEGYRLDNIVIKGAK